MADGKKESSLFLISLLQALGQALYIGLVSIVLWNGNRWFGPTDKPLAPVLALTLFVVSAIVSGFIVLGYPLILFWEKKETRKALKLVAYTAGWLALLVLILVILLIAVF